MLQRTLDTLEYLRNDPVGEAKTGQTPHEIIFRGGKSCVRYFAPVEAKHRPLFISMPLINTWNIWDLLPGSSLVAALRDQGFPVYLLDWGKPGPEDAANPLSYYIDTVLGRAIDRSTRHARARYGVDQLDAIGYCVGGSFLAIHIARHPQAVRKLALVAAPIDFHRSGRLALWAEKDAFPVDALIDGVGNYPGSLMKTSFSWLKPAGQTRKYVSLWERIEDPQFRTLWAAMEQWAGDEVDFPGEAYREYITGCYFDNALMNGGWSMSGTPVDLKQATIPALAIAASDDHIATPEAVKGLVAAWGGPVEYKVIKGGHVGISVQKSLSEALTAWFTS